jgi:hypothetical protein
VSGNHESGYDHANHYDENGDSAKELKKRHPSESIKRFLSHFSLNLEQHALT